MDRKWNMFQKRWKCRQIKSCTVVLFDKLGPDLQDILQQSYDRVKVTSDLWWTSNFKTSYGGCKMFWIQFTCKIVMSSETVSVNWLTVAWREILARHKSFLQHTHNRLTACGLAMWVTVASFSWTICKSAPCYRQITVPAPHHSVFTGRRPFLPPNQQRQSTEGASLVINHKLVCKSGRWSAVRCREVR